MGSGGPISGLSNLQSRSVISEDIIQTYNRKQPHNTSFYRYEDIDVDV